MKWLLSFSLAAMALPVLAADRPNVIVILADDLGVSDLGCYGNPFHETPHLDKLASEGIRFADAYSACTVCSPTRAALLTGQYPARLHVTDWITGHVNPKAKLRAPDWTMHLKPEHYSMPRAFKEAGYATASIGKWHLGGPEFYPGKHGFDINIAGTDKGQPPSYFSPYKIATLKDGPSGEHISDRLTAEACQWISSNRDKPFFLYLPHFAVHTPLQAKKEVIEKYKAKAMKLGVARNAAYAALLESLDDSVGAIRQKLAELKLTEKTFICFTSDNGGLLGNAQNPVTTNPPYRAGKGSAYEGGVRVPLILSVPKDLAGGGLRSYPTIMTIDIFPTLAAFCGLDAVKTKRLDGVDYSTLLRGAKIAIEPNYYWHYPHYHPGGATPYSAILTPDKYRLIEFHEDSRIELYDLNSDVGEKTNLADKKPDIAKRLRDLLVKWRQKVGAQMPTSNPKYDPKN